MMHFIMLFFTNAENGHVLHNPLPSPHTIPKGADTMDFQKESNRIYCENEAGQVIAEITFPETESGIFCIDHTFVDDSLRGQGVAGKLVKMAVEEIQSRNGKVTATCSYAQHWLEKHQVS